MYYHNDHKYYYDIYHYFVSCVQYNPMFQILKLSAYFKVDPFLVDRISNKNSQKLLTDIFGSSVS